jgi:hypothetical protein
MNSAIMSTHTKESDAELNDLLTQIEITLKSSLAEINILKDSHKVWWDEKIKRLGPTNFDSLTILEQRIYADVYQKDQRRKEIAESLENKKKITRDGTEHQKYTPLPYYDIR